MRKSSSIAPAVRSAHQAARRRLPTAGPPPLAALLVLASLAPSPPALAQPDARPPAAPSTPASAIVSVAVPVGDSGFARGRATVVVRAPIERVRSVVLGFARYPEFMPHYEKCRVLGPTSGGGRDVYMEVSALHGALKMWARLEIAKPVTTDGVETYPSRYLAGNVKDLQATWRLKKLAPAETRLSLEVFLLPKLPLPKSVINSENLEGATAALAAMRSRIETSAAPR